MQRTCGNIYQTARKVAGLTQEQAAERLNVSVRSLADYEIGKTVPKDDIVCAMMRSYGTRWLGYQHLHQGNIRDGRSCSGGNIFRLGGYGW
ncbi:MAG: helix-turn-helix transcriptional regulator, partial [Firmicutes bacterium]|nr:helix-turn-helix transcriptional regulator [Bacillota bacterium]